MALAQLLPMTKVDDDPRRDIFEATDTSQDNTVRATLIQSKPDAEPLGNHYHDHPETFVLTKGAATLYQESADGKETSGERVEAPMLIVIPAGTAHTFVPLGGPIELVSVTDCTFAELGTHRKTPRQLR